MNKALYRAKLKEIRDAVTNPAGASGVHAIGGKKWATTFSAGATFARIKLKGGESTITIVFQKSDMYVQGFETPHGKFKFTDAVWAIDATSIGYGSSYASLGWNRLSAFTAFDAGDLSMAIDNVAGCQTAGHWLAHKSSLTKLVIAFAEGARFHSVQDSVESKTGVHDIDWNAGGARVLALVKG